MPPLSPIPPSPLPSNTSPMSLKSSSPISVSPNEVSILQRLGSINSSRLGSQRYHSYITSAYGLGGWVGLENDPFELYFHPIFITWFLLVLGNKELHLGWYSGWVQKSPKCADIIYGWPKRSLSNSQSNSPRRSPSPCAGHPPTSAMQPPLGNLAKLAYRRRRSVAQNRPRRTSNFLELPGNFFEYYF